MGMHSTQVISTPSAPEVKPMMTVSALNMEDTFRLEAPMARKMPISLVRSWTEIKVMTPIIMEETTRDTATKAMSTSVMALMMVVMEESIRPM